MTHSGHWPGWLRRLLGLEDDAARDHELQELSGRVQFLTRQLSRLPDRPVAESNEPVDVLRTSCLLLERLLEARQAERDLERGAPEAVAPVPDAGARVLEPARPSSGPPKPSPTALDLIAVRDHLLAQGDEEPSAELLVWLYRRLGEVLEGEGVVTLEKTGAFDVQFQEIVGTRPAPDPTLEDDVAATVRPGYMIDRHLIRAQQVVVFAEEE